MSQAPLMPMFWDAYLADTTHLTTEEHGAYLLLLGAMWRRNGWVPDDDKDVARILGLTPAKWRKIKERLRGFLTFDQGRITQKNLLKIWENTQEKIAKNRENGARGGRPKANKNKDLGKANGFVSHNPNETIPEPEPELREEREDPPLSPKGEKPRRAASLPEGWVPSERNISDAMARNFSEKEIHDEADKFRDYHHAKGTRFKDWDAGWRTWLGNARKFSGRGMAVQANATRYGQGSSIASIVARRRADGSV